MPVQSCLNQRSKEICCSPLFLDSTEQVGQIKYSYLFILQVQLYTKADYYYYQNKNTLIVFLNANSHIVYKDYQASEISPLAHLYLRITTSKSFVVSKTSSIKEQTSFSLLLTTEEGLPSFSQFVSIYLTISLSTC